MVKVSRLLIFLLFLSGFATLQAAQKFENPRDGILMISSKEFRSSSPGIWEYVEKMTDFPFDEMIYSWNLRLAEGEGFRLYLSLYMSDDTESPWLYAGYWGSVKPRGDDIMTTFSAGIVDYDHVKLTASARGLRFRVVSEGAKPLAQAPEMRVIFTDNYTEAEPVKAYVEIPARVLDVPLRAQTDTSGVRIPDTCQSAALCSAMQYFGKEVPLEEVAEMIRDPEYHLRGIWPRIVGASIQKGFNAYIDRFRNWTKVREALSANKVILCSITMPENDTYIDPPYPKMSGHIVALCGVTDDGRVIVADSALAKSGRGDKLQWLVPDFEKIWMRNKGGVALVICPPPDAVMKEWKEVPPFPSNKKPE